MSSKNVGDDDAEDHPHEKRSKRKPKSGDLSEKGSKPSKPAKSKHKKGASKLAVASSPQASEMGIEPKTSTTVSKLSYSMPQRPPTSPSPASELVPQTSPIVPHPPNELVPYKEESDKPIALQEVTGKTREVKIHEEAPPTAPVPASTAVSLPVVNTVESAGGVGKEEGSDLKNSAMVEEPKRLFPDMSYLPPEEAVAAIREGRRPSSWVPRKEDSIFSTQGAQLMSAINRMTKEKRKDQELSETQQYGVVMSPGMDVAETIPARETSSKTKQRKEYHAYGSIWTAISKLNARYFQKSDAPSKNIKLTPREHFILCTLAVVLILPIVAIVIAQFKKHVGTQAPLDCSSAECMKIYHETIAALNRVVKPCDDFYSYTCGNWDPKGDASTFMEEKIDAFYHQIDFSFVSPLAKPPSLDRYGTRALFQLYTACRAFLSASIVSLADIIITTSSFLDIEHMVKSGNFSEIVLHLFNVSLTRGIHTAFILQLRRKGENIYLHLLPGTSIKGKMKAAHTVGHPGGSRSRPLPSDLEKYVTAVLNAVYSATDNGTYAQHLVRLDRTIDTLLWTSTESGYQHFNALADLVSPCPIEELLSMINDILPAPRRVATVNDLIYAPALKHALAVRQLTEDSPVLLWALYFAVHLVMEVLRYDHVRASPNIPAADRPHICMAVARDTLTHTWPYLYARTDYHPSAAVRVTEMGETIKKAIIAENLFGWMDNSTRYVVEQKLENVAIISYNETQLNKLAPDISYLDFSPKASDFVTVYLAFKEFETKILQKEPPTDGTYALSLYQLTSNLTYDADLNAVVVPTVYQRSPFFHSPVSVPPYFNFAMLGALITEQIVRAVGPPSTWSPESAGKFSTFMECIKNVHRSLQLRVPHGLNEAAWKESVFALTYGTRLIYDVTRHIIKSRGEEAFRDGWSFVQLMFFVRFCTMSCAVEEKGQPLLPKARCLLPLHTNVEFIQYFKCDQKVTFKLNFCVPSLFVPSIRALQ